MWVHKRSPFLEFQHKKSTFREPLKVAFRGFAE